MERRIAKTVDGAGVAYVYDMSIDSPLAFDDIAMEFGKISGSFVLERRWAQTDSVDEPLGFESYISTNTPGAGTSRLIYSDRQGSILWVTDPITDEVVAQYEYSGFGELSVVQGTLVQPFGYTGREYDQESGLYYYRARYMDPVNGLFLQNDPVEFRSGRFNISEYVSNNPYNANDPSGLIPSYEFKEVAQHRRADTTDKATVNFVGVLSAATGITKILTSDYFGMLPLVDGAGGKNSRSDCSGPTVTMYQQRVKFWEARATRCIPYEGPVSLPSVVKFNEMNLMYQYFFSEWAKAQASLNAICFRGGTGNHPAKLGTALAGMKRCGAIVKYGKSYKKYLRN